MDIRNMYVELFRVPNVEIFTELQYRSITHKRSQFSNYSSKALIEFVLRERKESLQV